jgi:tetratricopeptide (TPR) repeat protein
MGALLRAEKGVVLAARGDVAGATAAWRAALAVDPVQAAAFTGLAAVVLRARDVVAAQQLVDAALGAPVAHPEVLRRALQLALATEAEGIARASRVSRLCGRLLEMTPSDPWASLVLAKAQVVLGETAAARARLAAIEQGSPGTFVAAEAMAARFAVDEPAANAEVKSVLRAVETAAPRDLEDVAARARRLGTLHVSWLAWVAAGMAEKRARRWQAACAALTAAIEIAPGAAAAHVELAEALLATGDTAGATRHAERARSLEGESPRTTAILAKAKTPARAPWLARVRRGLAGVFGR